MVGPAEDELKNYSVELGLEQQVEWTGELAYPEVAQQNATGFSPGTL